VGELGDFLDFLDTVNLEISVFPIQQSNKKRLNDKNKAPNF